MRDLGVGALPICGDDDRLHGMITDRDIVIKAIAAGLDFHTGTAGELAQGSTYHVDAEASIEGMLTVMEELPVRRLPVIEEYRLAGMVSEADIARHLPEHAIAQFVKAICAPRPSPATDPAVSKRQSLPPTPTDHRFIAKGVSGRIIGGST